MQDPSEPYTTLHPPMYRQDCDTVRQCPWVRCRYHLGVKVSKTTVRETADIENMEHTCALNAARQGPRELPEIARILHQTPEAVRLTLVAALTKLRRALEDEQCDESPDPEAWLLRHMVNRWHDLQEASCVG